MQYYIKTLWSQSDIKYSGENFQETIQELSSLLSSESPNLFTSVIDFLENHLLKNWEQTFISKRKKEELNKAQLIFLTNLISFCVDNCRQQQDKVRNLILRLVRVLEKSCQDFLINFIVQIAALSNELKDKLKII